MFYSAPLNADLQKFNVNMESQPTCAPHVPRPPLLIPSLRSRRASRLERRASDPAPTDAKQTGLFIQQAPGPSVLLDLLAVLAWRPDLVGAAACRHRQACPAVPPRRAQRLAPLPRCEHDSSASELREISRRRPAIYWLDNLWKPQRRMPASSYRPDEPRLPRALTRVH
jgi:hypothetical protein